MKPAKLIVLLAVAAALVVAGCGGDDNDDKQGFSSSVGSGTTASISKEEFTSQANQICTQGASDLAPAQAAVGDSPEEITTFVTDSLVPSVQNQLDDIRALGAPAGEEEAVSSALDASQAGLDQLKADPSLANGGGPDPFAEANTQLDALGLTACGSGAGAEDPASTPSPEPGDDSGSADALPSGDSSSPAPSGGTVPDGTSTDSNDDGISDPYGE